MKKLIILMFVLVFAITLTSCSKPENSKNGNEVLPGYRQFATSFVR